jgi:hypothetical protein
MQQETWGEGGVGPRSDRGWPLSTGSEVKKEGPRLNEALGHGAQKGSRVVTLEARLAVIENLCSPPAHRECDPDV